MAQEISTPNNLVNVQEEDFLDQDPPIRGQNFSCISFIHPKEVIEKKEAFFFGKMLEGFSHDMNELFTALKTKYNHEEDGLNAIMDRFEFVFKPEAIHNEYFRYVELHPELEEEYFKKNDFRTTIHGFKIRGTYDTLREAQVRAEVLKRKDPNHNIFVAQVGCWCPWAPNPAHIEDQEYAETHLNTLMKKYKEEQAKKDIHFEQRKAELTKLAMEQKNKTLEETPSSSEGPIINATEEDPWIQRNTQEAA